MGAKRPMGCQSGSDSDSIIARFCPSQLLICQFWKASVMTINNWDRSYQATSIISVIASSLVVLTLLLFRSMQNKLFMQIIANISMADILGNMEYTTLYRPSNSAFWCSLQGFLNLYAYPCSWLWTTMLVRFLFDLAVFREIRISFRNTFIFCWGAPFVTTLLYFAFLPTGTYTRHDDERSDSFCSYGSDAQPVYVYHVITYYGLFIACVFYMAYLYIRIRQAYKVEANNIAMNASTHQTHQHRESTMSVASEGAVSTTSSATLQGMKLTSDSLLLNPLLMIGLWSPHTIAVLLSLSDPVLVRGQFNRAGVNLKILHGLFTAVLFFFKSQAARKLWMGLLCCTYKFHKTENEELEEENMYRDSEHSVSAYRITDIVGSSVRMTSPSLTSLAVSQSFSNSVTNPIARSVSAINVNGRSIELV